MVTVEETQEESKNSEKSDKLSDINTIVTSDNVPPISDKLISSADNNHIQDNKTDDDFVAVADSEVSKDYDNVEVVKVKDDDTEHYEDGPSNSSSRCSSQLTVNSRPTLKTSKSGPSSFSI